MHSLAGAGGPPGRQVSCSNSSSSSSIMLLLNQQQQQHQQEQQQQQQQQLALPLFLSRCCVSPSHLHPMEHQQLRQQEEPHQQREEEKRQQRWLPLEANPDVLGPYLEALGGPREGPPSSGGAPLLRFEDVVCLEPWAFDMLECRDTVALLLLFPLLRETDEEERSLIPMPDLQQQYEAEMQQELWFTKQASCCCCCCSCCCSCCCLLLLLLLYCSAARLRFVFPRLHVLHQQAKARFSWAEKNSWETAGLDGISRGAALEQSSDLAALHAAHQERGQTAAAAAADTDSHFSCLVEWRGFVVELDGRKQKPIIRARIDESQTFAQAAADVIHRQFVRPRGEDMHFAVLAVGDARSAQS
ncbi:hypothetical protein ACSSS7_002120 [Eimeria intestinalis]